MNIHQLVVTGQHEPIAPTVTMGESANLLLLFAPREWIEDEDFMQRVSAAYPSGTSIVGCSSAGEMADDQALGDCAVLTHLALDKTQVQINVFNVDDSENSHDCGQKIGEQMNAQGEDLSYVMIFSDGLAVNGSMLVDGLAVPLQDVCDFSGGLAGDGADFNKTVVVAEGKAMSNAIVAVGFYGSQFHSSSASVSGWKPFGPFRKVTKSQHNVVEELDGESALKIYSSYLGEEAENLPFSGLLYPLEVHHDAVEDSVIRTLLAVDEDKGTLTFAGDILEGSSVRLMNASYNYLVDGAREAATKAAKGVGQAQAALCVSCVGRKLAMGGYTDLEVEAVREVLPEDAFLCGFHSYGEIGPSGNGVGYDLHNQTMTVVFFKES
ncbi:FIST signal transduction protein [Rubritalea marina]|uniref:FIST signal transduction protein n=1 Tax=Rubritalea marina TaxID=361055 RepID=UPI0003677F7C|nr:FIST N-terminal domain-containing protein [Rubritalea marina]